MELLLFASFAAALTLGLAPSARADPPMAGPPIVIISKARPLRVDDDARRIIVRFGDLNLRSDEGAAQLVRRVHHASFEVCDPQSNYLSDVSAGQHCQRDSFARANVDVTIAVANARSADRAVAARPAVIRITAR